MASEDSASPTPTSNPPAAPRGPGSSSNYFTAFVIAFILFLVVFLSLGVLARRRRLRFIQELMLYAADDDGPAIAQTEPLLVEPVYEQAQKPVWINIMPLGASYLRRDMGKDSENKSHREEEAGAPDVDSPPSRWRNLFAKRRKETPPTTTTRQVTEALALVVVVSMPCEEEPPIYEIGSIRLPWHNDV